MDRRFFRNDNSVHKKFVAYYNEILWTEGSLEMTIQCIKNLSPRQQCQSQIPFKDFIIFIICTLITSVDEIHQLFLREVIEGKESRHLSNLKAIFLRPEQKKVRVIILNERSLEPRMLP